MRVAVYNAENLFPFTRPIAQMERKFDHLKWCSAVLAVADLDVRRRQLVKLSNLFKIENLGFFCLLRRSGYGRMFLVRLFSRELFGLSDAEDFKLVVASTDKIYAAFFSW